MMTFSSNSNTFSGIINDVYRKHCQDKDVYEEKMRIRQRLYDLFREHFVEHFDLFIVGSTQTQFALNSSDLDLCLVFYSSSIGVINEDYVKNKTKTIQKLSEIRNLVLKQKLCTRSELIGKAIVPILKFTYNCSFNIQVDLNINRVVTIYNTFLLTCYKVADPRVAPLVVSVKAWARQYGINSSYRNTLSSYNLTLMVIHFLQSGCTPAVLPRLQSLITTDFFKKTHHTGAMEDALTYVNQVIKKNFEERNKSSLGELFADFIHYYSQPQIFDKVISIRVLPYARSSLSYSSFSSYISIEDPFELKNTAYSVYMKYKYQLIVSAFKRSHDALQNGTFSAQDFHYERYYLDD